MDVVTYFLQEYTGEQACTGNALHIDVDKKPKA